MRDGRLSTDGRVLVTGSGSAAWVWNLAREERSLEDLRLLAQLLTRRANDAQGRVVPLDVKRVWQSLQTKAAPPRPSRAKALWAWHRRTLAQALEWQDRFAARFHVQRLLESAPSDASLRGLLAKVQPDPTGSWAGPPFVSDGLSETRSRSPPPALAPPTNVIDLSEYYTASLTEAPHTDWPSEVYNLSSLPRGVQPLAGVNFDIRGWVRLVGNNSEPGHHAVPGRINGIKSGCHCRRLHFLHGTGWAEAEGAEIARFIMRFADGGQSERPIRYGPDVQNFVWLKKGDQDKRRGRTARP